LTNIYTKKNHRIGSLLLRRLFAAQMRNDNLWANHLYAARAKKGSSTINAGRWEAWVNTDHGRIRIPPRRTAPYNPVKLPSDQMHTHECPAVDGQRA
ncbi:MAG: hypothetical protein R6U98_16295, partial [Pirellulaceae bacterium]